MIRQARNDDLKRLAKIEERCFPQGERADFDTIKKRFDVFPDQFLVLEINQKVVGFINGCTTDQPVLKDELYSDASLHQENGQYMTVFGLDVDIDYWHQGYATQLLSAYIDLAKKKQKRGVVLTCKDHLIGFYQRFGFEWLGVSSSEHGGVVWNDMYLSFE